MNKYKIITVLNFGLMIILVVLVSNFFYGNIINNFVFNTLYSNLKEDNPECNLTLPIGDYSYCLSKYNYSKEHDCKWFAKQWERYFIANNFKYEYIFLRFKHVFVVGYKDDMYCIADNSEFNCWRTAINLT